MRLSLLLPALAFSALALAGVARTAAGPEAKPVRVGVFDSRALAVAFTHSKIHRDVMDDLVRRRDAAKARGDDVEVQALEAQGQALQDRRHRQGFSTASVADVLEHLRDELPAIADAAGVDVIVSKWEVAWQRSGGELVDVTDALVAPLAPAAQTRKWIEDLRDAKPLPLYGTDWEALRRH